MSDVGPIRHFRGYRPDDPLRSPTVEELRQWRCPDGHPYAFHRLGARPTGSAPPLTDALELRCHGGHDRRIVYTSLYERAIWERIAPSVPEGLRRGDPLGAGDVHRRHLDFPRSLRPTTPDGAWATDSRLPEVRALNAVPYIGTDHQWYTGSAHLVRCPRLGGLNVGITIPSLAEAGALRFPAAMASIASAVGWFAPCTIPVNRPAPAGSDQKALQLTMAAAHFGWGTFAPETASLIPDPAGPHEAIAVESVSGSWTPETLMRQSWEPLAVGWDMVHDGRALLFPDYDGEGDAFGARTVAWLLRAGVPEACLTRRRGWFFRVPYTLYGELIVALQHAWPDVKLSQFPAGPVIDAVIAPMRLMGQTVPDDWQSEWDRMVGRVVR